MTTFTIPAELVPLARSGVYLDMHGALEDAGPLVQAAGREDPTACERYLEELTRIDDARELLDELQWRADGEPVEVEVDLTEHDGVLLAALRTQREAEQGHVESLHDQASPGCRRSQENAASLAGCIHRIEQAEPAEVLCGGQLAQGLRIEYLIVHELLDRRHPEVWTRRELEEELREDFAPEVTAAAVGRLRAAGAVVRDGERVRLSRCVQFLEEIGLVGV